MSGRRELADIQPHLSHHDLSYPPVDAWNCIQQRHRAVPSQRQFRFTSYLNLLLPICADLGFPVLRYTGEHGGYKWADVPYGVMIPKKLDGLIAVGRNASCIPDTLLRNREGVMYMGQAGGTAAAMAAREGINPRDVDVKALQKKLLQMGVFLGDETRLSELGLK